MAQQCHCNATEMLDLEARHPYNAGVFFAQEWWQNAIAVGLMRPFLEPPPLPLSQRQRGESSMKDHRMWFQKLLRALFPARVAIPAKSSKDVADRVAHDVVRAYARGNVNLQRGRYMTSEQLEARKQKLAQHAF